MNPVTVVLLGEPVAFARSMFGRQENGSGGFAVTPPKQRNAMAALRYAAQQAMTEANHGISVFDEPLRLDLRAEFQIPKSMSKRDRPRALTGEIRPGKRPDIDNLYKLAADALNTIVFRDDALIVEASLSKFYSDQPKVVITVRPIARRPFADLVAGMKNDTLEDMIDEESTR
jgi:Holliday junction resolvase RusA-like endonuclease